jgi:hypothetical protein
MRRAITLVVLVVLLAALGVIAYDRRGVQEHWLFLTRARTELTLPLLEISQQWQERSLHERFPALQIDCYNNLPGQYLGQRSCFADLTSLNGYPAMAIAFHMNGGYVDHVTVHIPSWAFGRLHAQLRDAYGAPLAEQPVPHADVRLAGWKLSSGSIFVNRDRPRNPLTINQILWTSDRKCARSPCWRDHPR